MKIVRKESRFVALFQKKKIFLCPQYFFYTYDTIKETDMDILFFLLFLFQNSFMVARLMGRMRHFLYNSGVFM